MERKRITCPETIKLELIDYDRTPLGVLIAGCSRFLPRCAMACSRQCAAHMDRRSDHLERVSEDTLPSGPAAARRLLPSGA
jgi:hypothetical protein